MVEAGSLWSPAAWRRRPGLLIVVLLGAGVACHTVLPPLPWLWWGILLASVVVSALSIGRHWISTPFLAIALFIGGLALAQQDAYYWPASDISSYSTETPRLAQLEMRIDDPPRVLVGPADAPRPIPPKQVTTATALRVLTHDGWRDTSGRLLVQIEEPHPRLQINQTVRVVGLLQRPAPASNPGQFDWADYYRRQRVLTSITISRADNIHILLSTAPNWLDRTRLRCRQLLAQGFTTSQSVDHALLRALLLGDNDPELRDIQDQFIRTGTSHHLSISGLHVAVLGGLVFFFCRLLRLRPRLAALATMAFVVMYGLIALPSPPVVRSVLLCAMLAIGLIGGRTTDPIHLLSISAFAMLLYHPLDLYSPGFQLSFGVVLGLMLLTPTFANLMMSLRDRDVLLAPKRAGPLPAVGRWMDHHLFTAFVAGVVAWLVSMPLVAWHFGRVNPWAIVASFALAVPVFASLIGGLMKIVLTFAFPSAAGTWATLAAGPIWCMRRMLAALDTLPGSSVPLAPPWQLLMACYVLLLAAIFIRTRSGFRWALVILAVGSYAALLVLPVQRAVAQHLSTGDELRVTLLSVGAGQCAVIEPPGGRTTLIDAGSTSLTDLWRKCLGPFLHAEGQTALDTIIVSHGDVDHISAVSEAVSIYDVREVLTGPLFAANAGGNPAALQMLATLDDLNRPPRIVTPGDVIPLGKNTRIEILWPPPGQPLPDNDSGVVLKLTHNGCSILFPADIQDIAMGELLKNPARIKADILIAPHHGSSETLTQQFVNAVDPKAILSSNDRTLSYKQRRFETLIGPRPLYRTNECGAITITIDAKGAYKIEPFLKSMK